MYTCKKIKVLISFFYVVTVMLSGVLVKKFVTFLHFNNFFTDIVGTSVLTLAGVAAKLGWVFVIMAIVLMCPVAVYSAVMMVRARILMERSGFPAPTSMGHATSILFQNCKCAATSVYTLVYGFALLGNASYLLVIGTSLQGAVFSLNQTFCLPTAVAISCLVLLPLVVGMRFLTQSIWICMINMIILLVALIMVIVGLFNNGRDESVQTYAFASGRIDKSCTITTITTTTTTQTTTTTTTISCIFKINELSFSTCLPSYYFDRLDNTRRVWSSIKCCICIHWSLDVF